MSAAVTAETADLLGRAARTADERAVRALREHVSALVAPWRPEVRRARFRPAYVERLQEIRRLQAQHEADLQAAWVALEARIGHDRAAFARDWQAIAAGWSFARVNRLIAEHNARYPLERSLPFDPAVGDYVAVGGRPYRRTPLDARWVLDRFGVAPG